MPPTIAPNESREQATIRWLTRLLAALVHQSPNGVLTVKRHSLALDHEGLDLVESRDTKGNIQLRFETVRHIAVYPLAGGAQWAEKAEKKEAKTSVPSPEVSTGPSAQANLFEAAPPGPVPSSISPPKNQETIRRLEEVLKKQKLVNQIIAGKLRQTQAKQISLEGLLESVGALAPQ